MVAETGDKRTRARGVSAGARGRMRESAGIAAGLVGGFGSITWRVLAVNVLALAILAAGLLYLDRYKTNLIHSQLDSLVVQGGIFAAALGEAAVITNPGAGRDSLTALARPMVRRLAIPAGLRARLFAANGDLIADSQYYGRAGGQVQVTELPPPEEKGSTMGRIARAYEWIVRRLPARANYPRSVEHVQPQASDFVEASKALSGEVGRQVRRNPDGSLVLSVAIPVQRYKQVLGALMLSTGDAAVRAGLRAVRLEILSVFIGVLVVTVLLSLWLAGTIAQPVRLLAAAAERVRHGEGQEEVIPDFTERGDEIGELSGALREMTRAIWSRMEAIERFAADVAHEIKNPLTSLRSAVETAARVEDPDQQRRLMAIIMDDVERLDRLITDISNASRVDAELGRAQLRRLDLAGLLTTVVEIERVAIDGLGENAPALELDLPGGPLMVMGIADRLSQVFRNLISNAVSFSPPRGVIRLAACRVDDAVRVTVTDEGPGLPPGKVEAIFERFYTERPEGEKFGTHSGLGLSISRQIVAAHRGRIEAENAIKDGRVAGARFTVTLPAAGDG